MGTKLEWTDPSTSLTHRATTNDLHIYPPDMIPSLRILTDPSRCDLDSTDPIDSSFLLSLVRTGGNIEPILARKDSSGTVWVFEGRRRLSGTSLINSDPTHWAQFTPPGINPPPLPLQVRLMRVTEEEALRLSLHGNNSKKLTAMDYSYAARNFINRCGWDRERVATELGVSQSQVSYLLRLLDLPTRVQKALHKGKLKTSEAQQLYGLEIDAVDVVMDRFDAGESHREIFLEIREAKRTKASTTGGRKPSRTLAELKADLERIAAGSGVEAANRASAILDYLAGNESRSLQQTLGAGQDDQNEEESEQCE